MVGDKVVGDKVVGDKEGSDQVACDKVVRLCVVVCERECVTKL